MNGKLLEEYDKILERLENIEATTKEMVFNLMNIEDKNELDLVFRMEDKYLIEYLKIDHDQLNLNKDLYDECLNEEINKDKIESLLKDGADPTGIYIIESNQYSVWLNCVLDEIMFELIDNENIIPLIELFFKYGLRDKLINCRHLYDGNISNPLEEIRYYERRIDIAIKLIDICMQNNTDIDSLEDLIDYLYMDISMIGSEEATVKAYVTMLLYLASFKDLLDNSNTLQDYIEIKNNNYDVSLFRNIDKYDIHVDYSTALHDYNNIGVSIYIYKKQSDVVVWKMVLY